MSIRPRGLVRYLVRHPLDTRALLVAGWRLRRRGWWRQAPFMPVPDPNYWNFRNVTAFGESERRPLAAEAAVAARWSLQQGRGR